MNAQKGSEDNVPASQRAKDIEKDPVIKVPDEDVSSVQPCPLKAAEEVPVQGATKYNNQTCPDEELNEINKEKKEIKIELSGKEGKDRTDAINAKKALDKSEKLIKRYVEKNGCVHFQKRRDNLETLLEIRTRERDNCFNTGPISGDPQSEKAYEVHQDQIDGTEKSIKKIDSVMTEYC